MGDHNSTERENVYKMFAARFYNIFTIRFLQYFYNTVYNTFRKARVYNGFYNISRWALLQYFYTIFLLQIPFSL